MLPPMKTALPGVVSSAEQLIAIAHAMEREAARRYRELAVRMRIQSEDVLATLFIFLAEIEDKHAMEVEARAEGITGHPPDLTSMPWDVPENFDEEEARSAGLSPYRALAIAVRNEERAFVFYTYVAASAATPMLARLAEQFAVDELGHAGLLRRERRKAWRRQTPALPPPTDTRPESVDELLALAIPMERAAAAAHRALALRLATRQEPEVAALFDHAADEEGDLSGALAVRLPSVNASPPQSMRAGSVRDGLRILEDAFERYTDIAEKAIDEATLLEAQALAQHALRRLAYVHGTLARRASSGAPVSPEDIGA